MKREMTSSIVFHVFCVAGSHVPYKSLLRAALMQKSAATNKCDNKYTAA